ncbi:MAG: phosphate ABC transporter substrate-binding protein PstS [Mycobacterium sp.]
MPSSRLAKISAVVCSAALAITATSCGSGVKRATPCAGKRSLTASGSSAQAEAIAHFNNVYETVCRGRSVDYTPIGSAAGRKDFITAETDFAGSDTPLGAEVGEQQAARLRCGGSDAWNLPMVFGAVAIVYNVAGLDALTLNASTAAKIFDGEITAWDAPEIAALNPDSSLPSQPIVVVSRSDESGTTDAFQRYLESAGGASWGRGIGESFKGVIGKTAVGNDGVWSAMRRSAGSITYTAWPFARKNGLRTTDIATSLGSAAVALSVDSVRKTVDGVSIKGRGNDLVIEDSSLLTPTVSGAYPIALSTYEIVCSHYPDPETAAAVKAFLEVALTDGQAGLAESGYVSIPDSVKGRLTAAINAIS